MLHALIMAGGAGTRFWPASRAARPKQLMSLSAEGSLLQTTVGRLEGLVPSERIMVLTADSLVPAVEEQLEGTEVAVFGEPCRRDTGPCIGLAALMMQTADPEAVMAVFPADHLISPVAGFRDALRAGAETIRQFPQSLVTYGIQPTYPAERFGYIERGEPLVEPGLPEHCFRVLQFCEKPAPAVAREYLAQGRHYWNAGIFLWRAATIIAALDLYQPKMMRHLRKVVDAFGTPEFRRVFEREFSEVRAISIDYAVLEHYADTIVIEAPFSWDDVGGWKALSRVYGEDSEGNTILGRHVGSGTNGCIVRSTGDHLVATLGIKDCLIVHTPDATLVADKHSEEAVRELVKQLRERGWEDYL